MRDIDYILVEDLEELMDAMLDKAEKETKKKRMPDSIKINISNAKYGHHGDGNMNNKDKAWCLLECCVCNEPASWTDPEELDLYCNECKENISNE